MDTLALEALCGERPEARSEIFSPNSWYGAADTVRAYCGWPNDRPIPVVLPHGVNLVTSYVWSAEQRSRLPAIYSYPPHRDEVYRRHTDKVVIPGCSPWLYLEKGAAAGQMDDGFVLIMPAHSSHHVRSVMDHHDFARKMSERFSGERITCCMYWRDVQLGHHLAYVERGMTVVSAGHIFDVRFMQRLAAIFAGATTMVTTEFGSHVFYAADAGIPVFVTSDVAVRWEADPDVLARDTSADHPSEMFTRIEPLFQTEQPDRGAQRQAAASMLGRDRMHTPAQLRQVLDEVWQAPAFRTRVVLPWRIRRFFT